MDLLVRKRTAADAGLPLVDSLDSATARQPAPTGRVVARSSRVAAPSAAAARHRAAPPASVLAYFQQDAGTAPALATPVAAPAPAVQPAAPPPTTRAQVFCDGACSANGRRGARAAYGVSLQVGGAEVLAIAEPLAPAEPQTNQRAELRALLVALTTLAAQAPALAARGCTGADVHSDSEYALKSATTWGRAWRGRGWRKSTGDGKVQHLDLVQPLVAAADAATAAAAPLPVALHHVRGHQARGASAAADGNRRADELATGALRG
jgi:ribonuclease HI